MRLPQIKLHTAKNAAHATQALTIFLGWCLTIAVFAQDGSTDGRTKYYFALCWFSLPALIYLTMVPMWPRAKKFANAYAIAAIDVVFTILWFAAFIAVATWNSAGISAGAAKKKVDGGNCSTFDYGPEQKCKLSEATVGMGVVIFLLFAATSGISLYGVTYYRRNGTLPGTTLDSSDPSSIEAQTKDAFSSTPHDAEYDDDGTHTERAHGQDDEYALLHANDGGEGRHGVRPMSWTRDDAPGVGPRSDYDTSYHTGGVYDTHHAPGDPFNNDLAPRHDHGSYAGGRLDFPDAPYNR